MATKQTTKKSTQSKGKLKPEADDGSSALNAYEGVGKQSLSFFGIGFALVLFAIFMLIAFISYLFTGDVDYSLLDGNGEYDSHDIRNICGSLGANTAFFFLNNCFGLASFIIPPFFILVGFRLMNVYKIKLVKKFVVSALFMLWLSVCLAFVGTYIPYLDRSFLKLGGMHGILVIDYLTGYVGVPGIICTLALFAVFFLVYISTKTVEVIRGMLRLSFLNKLKEKRRLKAEAAAAAAALAAEAAAANNADAADIAEGDAEDDGDASEDEAEDMEEEEEGDGEDVAETEDDDNDDVVEDEAEPTPSNTISLDDTDSEQAIADALSALNAQGLAGSQHDDELEVTIAPNPETVRVGEENEGLDLDVTVAETELGTGEIVRDIDPTAPYDPHKDLETYKYPTLDLLASNGDSSLPSIDMAEQNANKLRIQQVLRNFGVEISSIKATIGPTITLYEIVPAEGTRISKIRNLEDDIALSLAAEGIRIIAPIPGKGTIGIEVPNKKKCIVSMESVLSSRTYQESTMELPCAVGKTISNEVFMFDLAKAPHLLVAGATGQGKSVGLNAIVTSLLYKKHPSELKIVMVDPKKVEFSIYSPIENHFLARLEEEEDCIITDVQKVVKTLNSLCVLMDTRYDLLKKAGVRNIKEYNAMFKERRLNPEHGHEYMPYIVVIVDEFGDLIMTAGKEVELPICRIAQLARAVGIHMIIATQRPQASIISGAIKTNFPTRIAFKVSSMMDSRVILDRSGANQLIGKGDMLYLAGAEPVRVQCAFVDTPEVSNICHFIARQQSYLHPMYLPDVPAEGDADMGGSGSMDSKHLDPLFAEVAEFVVSTQQGSTSMIQRNYSIGYNRAGKIMDQLEKMGVVGKQVGSKPRQVLIQDHLTLESLLNSIG
ncbi:MAG: DNA translocase FtsK [Bacteroidaceae bacterium]|nr:DNA translocase FtsK [Bacteroidaceae bacterium]